MSDARRTSHRARTMGFIFQAFNLIPVFSAAENVELPLLPNSVPARRAQGQQVTEMLERAGLGHRTGHRPNQPRAASSSGSPSPGPWPPGRRSSGPTSRPATSTPTWPTRPALLHELNREQGQTIVLVTHDLASAAGRPGRAHARRPPDRRRAAPAGTGGG